MNRCANQETRNTILILYVSFQTPEDWVRGMTTKDSAGFFPSCDPLFATLTAAVLERDIVIVQAEAELYASVSKDSRTKGICQETSSFFNGNSNLKAIIIRETIDSRDVY